MAKAASSTLVSSSGTKSTAIKELKGNMLLFSGLVDSMAVTRMYRAMKNKHQKVHL